MELPALAVVVVAALALGYRFYGRYVAAQFALDDGVVTPAHRKADGVDFVPTRPFYLFGQHFSAIAAAGPIVGPILACQQFGWLPCLLWIGFGVVFIGAVHDAATLVASVRHDAKSIAEVVKLYLGRRAWLAILASSGSRWST
jgi:carbon starvation protein